MNQMDFVGAPKNHVVRHRIAKSVFIILAHYLALPLFILSAWSGFNISRDQRAWQFLDFLPGMQSVPLWHLLAAVAWGVVLVAYSTFYYMAHSRPRSARVTSHQRNDRLHRSSLKILYLTLTSMLLSGILLWSNQLGFATYWLRQIHLLTALVFVISVLFHIIAQWPFGWWRRLSLSFDLTRFRHLDRRLYILVLGGPCLVALFFCGFAMWWQNGETIVATRINGEITIDGFADETQWKKAKPITVASFYAMNQQSYVPIEVKMINDGYSLYVHVRWPDPSKSMRHLPLVKTERGWRVQQTAFLKSDESQFYEDKLAVMLASNPWDALRSVFLSSDDVRGGHRMEDKQLVDIWHWKSVRNHGFANLDDAFFGSDLKPIPGQRRYTWGYASDPLLAGSYVENWDYFLTDVVRPLRLPRKPERLQDFQKPLQKDGANDPVFGMHWIETQPYHESLDRYPIGTVMPSVVWYHPNEGDRADVRAAGVWKDGYWHLEMARNFETGSDHDLEIGDGSYFWFASFDHSQVRHTYHVRPLRLRLEK